MSSTLLTKYIYANSYEDALVKGKKIFKSEGVSIVEREIETHSLITRIKDDVYNIFYKTTIRNYNDSKHISIRCNCNSKSFSLCKHKIASLFVVCNLLEKEGITTTQQKYNQKHSIVAMKNIDLRKLKLFSSNEVYDQANKFLNLTKIKIIESKQGTIKGELKLEEHRFQISLHLNANKEFETNCNCNINTTALCIHKVMFFLQIFNHQGANYFDEIMDITEEKQLILDYYESQQENKKKQKKEWIEKQDKTKLKITHTSDQFLDTERIQKLMSSIEPAINPFYGLLFSLTPTTFPFFELALLHKKNNKIEKIKSDNSNKMAVLNKVQIDLVKEIAKTNTAHAYKEFRKIHFEDYHDETLYYSTQAIPTELRKYFYKFYIKHFNKITNHELSNCNYFIIKDTKTELDNATAVTFSNDIQPRINIEKQNDRIIFSLAVKHQDKIYQAKDNLIDNKFLFVFDNKVFFWKHDSILDLLIFVETLENKKTTIKEWNHILTTYICPLIEKYDFNIDKALIEIKIPKNVSTCVFVKESENYLKFNLEFSYDNEHKIEYNAGNYFLEDNKKNHTLIKRNKEFENKQFEILKSISADWDIIENDFNGITFFIKKNDALKDRWFLNFLEEMQKNEITLLGLEHLTNFIPEEKTPQINLDIKSGIDWLDVDISIVVEDEELSLTDLMNTLKNNHNTIRLKNNKILALSQTWIKKYKIFFAFAEKKQGNSLRFKNSQLGVIQYLEKEGDQDFLSINWDKRFKALKEINNKPKIELPYNLNSVLRNFQYDSTIWANSLNKNNCNGLLSDDMGLGKTLQALSILSLFKHNNDNKLFALIICPTSLTHTWQHEIEKFTPDLKYIIYHGKDRMANSKILLNYNIVITTYGTMRNDLYLFKNVNFDYAVLDESQIIKNPTSKTYQSLMKLNSRYKLCLSGTPLQNNTIDIFAQLNFLNHGMFGSLNWFKNQFSTPIDRFGDYEIKSILKKILHPLVLRRTKEEVSPELPAKTISTIYCEMSPAQQKIYDTFKTEFRNSLMGKIQKDGLEKTKFHILQSLLILRQICNSPSLVNWDYALPEISIKSELVVEQIINNLGNHKVLIFSQFLGMLHILRNRFKKENIQFEYLDGSMSSAERQKSVKNFQSSSNIQVFLISMKAGGLGLTLTEADYVYIIDPWWNPTVEAQAIDRTHRIGQTKNIFANKLICKNTVEEKIIHLQKKKISLNNEIIESDDNLIKNINYEDIEYLFN